MEIGVRVAAENSFTRETRHVLSAYLTFVALDEHGQPVRVPEVRPRTADDKRRYRAAGLRREARLRMRREISGS